jgi:hypothetical protein
MVHVGRYGFQYVTVRALPGQRAAEFRRNVIVRRQKFDCIAHEPILAQEIFYCKKYFYMIQWLHGNN